MGETYSKSVVDKTVNSFMSLVHNVGNSCSHTVVVSQKNTVEAKNGGVIYLDKFTTRQFAQLDSSCYINSIDSVSVDEQFKEMAKQKAESITTDLNLLGTATAETIYKSVYNLGQSILSSVRNSCKSTALISQDNDIKADNGVVIAKEVNWTQNAKTLTDCVIKNQSVVSAKKELESIIDQYSKTKVTPTLAYIVIAIAVVIVIIVIIGAVVFFKSGGPEALKSAATTAATGGLPIIPV